MSDLHDDLIESHPSLSRRKVWCRHCCRELDLNGSGYNGLRDGWPKCCGYTMTIDHPSTWPGERE